MKSRHASLHQRQRSPSFGWLAVLLLACNLALLIYSHVGISAEVMITARLAGLCPSAAPTAPAASTNGTANASGGNSTSTGNGTATAGGPACGAADAAVWNAMGTADSSSMLRTCASGCAIAAFTSPVCVTDCTRKRGFSATCSACWGDLGVCAVTYCMQACLAGSAASCAVCALNNCYSVAPSCSALLRSLTPGVGNFSSPSPSPAPPVPGVSPSPAASPLPSSAGTSGAAVTPAYTGGLQWYLVPDASLSFMGSVTRAWKNGAVAVAFCVVFLSCAWPYTKLILLSLAWFCPMPLPRCRRILLFTNVFGRLGLCDIFVVSALMAGVNFRLLAGVYVATRSRFSVYTLVIGGVWSILLGEWMMHRLRLVADQAEHYETAPEPTTKVQPLPADKALPQQPSRTRGSRLGLLRSLGLVLTATAGAALAATGMFAPGLRFWVGNPIPGQPQLQNEYSVATVGSLVWQPLIGTTEPGDRLLAVLYFTLAVACPLLAGGSMALVGLLSLAGHCGGRPRGDRVPRAWWGLASLWANLSCLDVMYFSALITVPKYGNLVTLVSHGALCGQGLKAGQTFLWATWVGIAGCVLLWVAQALLLHTPRYGPHSPSVVPAEGPGAPPPVNPTLARYAVPSGRTGWDQAAVAVAVRQVKGEAAHRDEEARREERASQEEETSSTTPSEMARYAVASGMAGWDQAAVAVAVQQMLQGAGVFRDEKARHEDEEEETHSTTRSTTPSEKDAVP